jgi:hypothetical protein
MATTLTPVLTTTPNSPVTYNAGMAETFSWVPVEGANRPLFAKATYLVNASDISLSAGNVNIDTSSIETLLHDLSAKLNSQMGQSGFVFVQPSNGVVTGQFTTIQVVSTCKLATISATNSITTGLTNYELPLNFTFNGPITTLSLTYGAAIAYKL